MSWTASATIKDTADLSKLEDSLADLTNESREQYEVACDAVQTILDSGALGRVDGSRSFAISLSGHANAGHEPAEGWANDALTISIAQIPE